MNGNSETQIILKSMEMFVNYLNEVIQCDAKAVDNIFSNRVPCNDIIIDHEKIQCTSDKKIGILGILNGFFGANPDHNGFIYLIGADYSGGHISRFCILRTSETWEGNLERVEHTLGPSA